MRFASLLALLALSPSLPHSLSPSFPQPRSPSIPQLLSLPDHITQPQPLSTSTYQPLNPSAPRNDHFDFLRRADVLDQEPEYTVCTDLDNQAGTSAALIDQVINSPFSIGYTGSQIDIDEENLMIANLSINGQILVPSADSVAAAIDAETSGLDDESLSADCTTTGLCLDILGSSAPGAWPITTFTNLIVSMNFVTSSGQSCSRPRAIFDFIIWMLDSEEAHQVARDFHFVPMNQELRQIVLDFLNTSTCNGVPLYMIDRGEDNILIRGAGSSLAARLYQELGSKYTLEIAKVPTIVEYESIGSSNGIAEIVLGNVDFAGSDILLKEDDLIPSARTRKLRMFPDFASAVVLVVNPKPGEETQAFANLALSMDVTNDIFLGKISCWNHPRIMEINPGVDLPNSHITRVVRNGGSGTTKTLTTSLAYVTGSGAVDSCLLHALKCSKSPEWPGVVDSTGTPISIEAGQGDCPCMISTGEVDRSYIRNAIITLVAVLAIFVIGCSVYLIGRWNRARADKIWAVGWEEIDFEGDEPEILGNGSFGVVTKARFRGIVVACKRLLTPQEVARMRNQKGFKTKTGDGSLEAMLQEEADQSDTDSDDEMIHQSTDLNLGHVSVIMSLQDEVRSEWTKGVVPTQANTAKGGGGVDLLNVHGRGLSVEVRKRLISEVRVMIGMRHPNLCPIMGACLQRGKEFILMQFFEFGSIRDMFDRHTALTFDIQMELAHGIASGMQYLHLAKPPLIHKDLKAANVLVDAKFTAKVSDFGMTSTTSREGENVGTLYWNAPELLDGMKATRATDVYAFGITLYEVFHQTNKDIYPKRNVWQVVQGVQAGTLRPDIDVDHVPEEISVIIKSCWAQDPNDRPLFSDVCHQLHTLLYDLNFMRSMAAQQRSSEEIMTWGSQQQLAGLKNGTQRFDAVAVFTGSIVNLEDLKKAIERESLLEMQHTLADLVQEMAERHDMYIMSTIGNSFMAVAGLEQTYTRHDKVITRAARFGIDMLHYGSMMRIDEENPHMGNLQLRIGLHTGPAVVSVVGSVNPRCSLFGPTVNVACQLEEACQPNKMHISEAFRREMINESPFDFGIEMFTKTDKKLMVGSYWLNVDHHRRQLAGSITLKNRGRNQRRMSAAASYSRNDTFKAISSL